jgi:hypothetical protein
VEQRETLSRGKEPTGRWRRRHGLLVAGALALVVALAVGLFSRGGPAPSAEPPPASAELSTPDARLWPPVRFPDTQARNDTPPLESAVYQIRPSWRPGAPTVRLRTFEGWYAADGPVQSAGRGFAGLLVLDVRGVVTHPCGRGRSWQSPVPGRAPALVRALVTMPRTRVVTAPERVDRFGHPTTHLRLRTTPRAAHCPGGTEMFLLDTVGSGVVHAPIGPPADLELWVVDVDGHPLLVMASSLPGTPARTLHELHAMVDSIRFVPGSSPR